MRMVHGLKWLLLTLSLSLSAKTLQVDTIIPSVTNGDMTISKNGSGDIVISTFSGVLKATSGVVSAVSILDIASGGTGSTTRNFVDLVSTESIAGIKTFTGELKTLSTTAPSVPAPVMTEAQRDLLSGSALGDQVINSDTNKLNIYDGSAWVEVGGGGGGGLDVYHTEDFEGTIIAASASTGNNATYLGGGTLDGTLSDDTTTEIAGEGSIKYVMGSSSTNDYVAFPSITLDLKQKSNDTYLSLNFTYDGDAGDIKFVAWDVTNTTILTSSLDIVESSLTSQRLMARFYVPPTATTIQYGFQVVTGNSGKILVVDDFTFSTDPTSAIVNIENTTEWTTYTPSSTQGFGTITGLTLEWRRDGAEILLRGGWTNGSVTGDEARLRLPEEFTVKSSTTTTQIAGVYAGNQSTTNDHGGFILVEPDQNYIAFSSGKTFGSGSLNGLSKVTGTAIGSSIRINLGEIRVAVEGWQAGAEHVITPAKSTLTDWVAYTPSNTQGFGTIASNNLEWRRVGDSMEIRGTFDTGTTTAVEGQIELPNSEVIATGTVRSSAGSWFRDFSSNTKGGVVIITNGDTFLNFSTNGVFGSDTTNALIPRDGNSVVASSQGIVFNTLTIPILGWSSDATFLAAIPRVRVAYLKDIKSSGTDGGDFTTGGWRHRDINTISGDSEIVSVSANEFTLQAGTYHLDILAPAQTVGGNRARLYDVTNSAVVAQGNNNRAATGGNSGSVSVINTTVTINVATTYKIEHRCNATQLTSGFGGANSYGTDEVYTTIKITGAITNKY